MKAMSARGPDGEGLHQSGSVLLGHRRLAILDPASGAQPWVDQASGVGLTYNGEVFNYDELRGSILAAGGQLDTRCDTEMILQAYLLWGHSCLPRLDGMFAFALHDPRIGEVWLVRDRLGVKPLYYHEDENSVVFASSVAALLALPGIEAGIDETVLAHYFLTIRSTLRERTLIRGVKTLLPGQSARIRLRPLAIDTATYWRLPAVAPGDKLALSPGEMAAGTVERVDESVRRQLISDVPVGGFLSGGIDSSILMSSIVREKGQRFHACSVGYAEDGFNEWSAARRAAERYGIDCREVILNCESYLGDWQQLVRFKGLPLSTPNEVPIYRLAQVFREKCTVAMTGEGADELFGGYPGPTWCAYDYDRAHSGRDPELLASLRQIYGTDRFPSRRHHFLRANAWLSSELQGTLLKSGRDWLSGPFAEVEAVYDAMFSGLEECSTLDAYLHVHARVNLEGLLNRLDSSTMASSVEGRVPFTDVRLAEWLFRLPDEVKMGLKANTPSILARTESSLALMAAKRVESKRLLRRGFAGRVDPEILHREKMSFPVPFNQWFSSIWLAEFQTALKRSELLATLLDEEVRRKLETSDRPDPMLAWPLMNLWQMEQCFGLAI